MSNSGEIHLSVFIPAHRSNSSSIGHRVWVFVDRPADDAAMADPDIAAVASVLRLSAPDTCYSRSSSTRTDRSRTSAPSSNEVLLHLVAFTGADVEVTLHIRATKPDGFDDGVIRTVTENARTLKFEPGSGFSEE